MWTGVGKCMLLIQVMKSHTYVSIKHSDLMSFEEMFKTAMMLYT